MPQSEDARWQQGPPRHLDRLRLKLLAPLLVGFVVMEAIVLFTPTSGAGLLAPAVALAVVATVAWVALGRAFTPLEVMSDAAHRVQEGDLTARVTVRPGHELRGVGEAFNTMVETLEARDRDVKRYAADLERRNVEFQAAMDTLSSVVAHAVSPRAVMERAVTESTRILGADAAYLYTLHDGVATLAASAPGRARRTMVRMEDTILADVAVEETVRLYEEGDVLPEGVARPVASALAVPLRVDGVVAGVLLVVDRKGERPLTRADAPLAAIFARQVGISMRNARLLDKVEGERQKYRALIENANDGILLRVGDTIILANPALCRLLGTDAFPMPVTTFFDRHVHPDDVVDLGRRYHQRLDGDDGQMRYETRLLTSDGVVVPVEVNSSVLDIDGTSGSQMFIRDLSVQKKNEEELKRRSELLFRAEKLAAIGTLAAGVAHEINNPLAFIKGNEQLSDDILEEVLADEALSSEARRAVEEIREGVQMNLTGIHRIETIVSSLKQFARPSAEREPVDMNRLLTETLVLSRNRLKDQVALTTELPEWLAPAWGNSDRIGQVLLNLVMNALDALPEEDPRLVIRAYAHDGDVVVEVQDNGAGIPDEVAPHLFDPFFTTKKTGTGLGLAISHRIVEEHRGVLEHVPAAGGGTIFRLRLPQAEAPISEPEPTNGAKAP